MMRLAILGSALLHGALVGVLLHDPPRRIAEPDELPGLEVLLGAIAAPGEAPSQVDAGPSDPPAAMVEQPPELLAEAPAPETTPSPPIEPQAPLARVPEQPAMADLPVPPPLPAIPDPPALAAAAVAPGLEQVRPPPRPRPPVTQQPAPPPRPAAPPPAPAEPPVVRPLFQDGLAALLQATPGTGTEGEQLPVREAPGIRNPLPVYPEAARQRGQQGAVGVRLRVDADGSVLRLEIVESSGHALLDQAVLDALRRWRFLPATQGGRPVAADFLHRTIFRLD